MRMHSGKQVDPDAIDGRMFDFIVCGGGTSGCVIAARLARIPNISVLLVESGRDSGLAPEVLIPGHYVKQLQEDKAGLWELETVPQRHLNNRRLLFLRGKQLGGSSYASTIVFLPFLQLLIVCQRGKLYGSCSRPGGRLR